MDALYRLKVSSIVLDGEAMCRDGDGRDSFDALWNLDGDGAVVFEHACKLGYEGIVAKRIDMPYKPGPSKAWLKIKNKAHPAIMRVKEAFELERERGLLISKVRRLTALPLPQPSPPMGELFGGVLLSSVMRSPSIVPGFDVDVYLVLDEFAGVGHSYRETDESKADRETVIRDLLSGQYENPVRIVCFNTAEGWSRDVTEDIAREIKERADREGVKLSEGLQAFLTWQLERVTTAS